MGCILVLMLCQIQNKRGLHLQCSHYVPVKEQRVQQAMPCVIYLHGNCSFPLAPCPSPSSSPAPGGCRLDALECLFLLLTHNITLFCFDFAGSGLSEGTRPSGSPALI